MSWETYIYKKTLKELTSHSFDITGLCNEVKHQLSDEENKKINDVVLHNQLRAVVAAAQRFEDSLSTNSLAKFNAAELQDFFSQLNPDYRYQIFTGDSASELYEELKVKNNVAVNNSAIILNEHNAQKALECMGNTIDPNSKSLSRFHKVFNKLRLALSDDDHKALLGCGKKDKQAYKINYPAEFIKQTFKVKYSPITPLSQYQIWQYAQKFTPEVNRALFGKKNIGLKDNIDIANLDWNRFFEHAKATKLKVTLEEHQRHLLLSNLTLEEALEYSAIYLKKAGGFGENTLQVGSQWLAAYGFEASKLVKILATLSNAALFIQQMIYMPALFLIGIFAAWQNHGHLVKLETDLRKDYLLSNQHIKLKQKEINNQYAQLNLMHQDKPLREHYDELRAMLEQSGIEYSKTRAQNDEKLIKDGKFHELMRGITQFTISERDNLALNFNTSHNPKTKKLIDYANIMRLQLSQLQTCNHEQSAQSEYNSKNMNPLFSTISVAVIKLKRLLKRGYKKAKPFIAPVLAGFYTVVGIVGCTFLITTNWHVLLASTLLSLALSVFLGRDRYNRDQTKKMLGKNVKQKVATLTELNRTSRDLHELRKIVKTMNNLDNPAKISKYLNSLTCTPKLVPKNKDDPFQYHNPDLGTKSGPDDKPRLSFMK